ncbi:hypothetical protein BCR35DRAFT_305193 [Leucosporidium creatinivorum]|uniref:MYND-type domain-containing protein n=1 Tax=Leucosporidium creatinivorum TaxID=106004 RepID=A0A1Y2F3Z4_9BASI|nr:hypothetical protein BCR35DRAFT_305193 [Leucosporidium creatinivorum]
MDRFAEEGTRKDASGLGMKNSVVEYVQNPSLFPTQSTKQVVLDTAASLAAHGAFCAFCGNLGADKKCSGCHWETYCSVGHQKKDWPHHRDW